MLSPLKSQATRQQQIARTASLAAPIGGWNVRDPLSAMPPFDAVVMENWFPEAHEVRVRSGAVAHCPINGTALGTLMPYNGPAGNKLFLGVGGASAGIYEVTANTPSAIQSATTDGKFTFVNYSTSGGNFLVAVNGVDDLRLYNGTSWATINAGSTPAITGVPTAELAFVTAMKKRLWFARRSGLSAWYLPADAIAGALVEFPMGSIFKRGGSLIAMADWSVDGGDGVDDHTVFVTSEGEIAIYNGSDPASATTWQLIGLFYIGEPLGRNCLTPFGGDLLYLCRYGLFPLSKALTSSTIDRKAAVTDKINVAFSQAVALYGNLDGWATTVFPGGPFVLVNIPTDASIGLSQQFAMNTLTGAWCKFTGWNAYSFTVWNSSLYFYGKISASTGGYTALGVSRGWTGASDALQPIVAQCQQAYNYFGLRGRQKHNALIRPTLTLDEGVSVRLGLETDFAPSDFASFTTLSAALGFVWDSAVWDTATWTPGARTQRNWSTVFAREFYAAAVRLQVASASGTVRWTATDLAFKLGAVL